MSNPFAHRTADPRYGRLPKSMDKDLEQLRTVHPQLFDDPAFTDDYLRQTWKTEVLNDETDMGFDDWKFKRRPK